MNRFRRFSVGFSYFFSTLIFHLSTCSFADQLSDHGRAVQTYAEGIVPKDSPTLSEDGKTVQFGSSSSSNISVNALFPGSDADPDQVVKALQDGADGAISTANDNKKKLYTDSNQPNSTTMGNAYGIARSTLSTPKSVSPTDGFLTRTSGLFSNIDEITESLGNCSSSISYSDAQQTTHIPDLHTCDVIYNPVGSCTIDHNVSVDSYKFTVSVSAQGRARTDAYINFKTGETTYKTDGSGVAIVYSKADYDRICSGRTVDIRFLGAKPRTGLSGRQSLIDGVGVSTSSFFGNPDTTFVAGVNVMPSCENGLKASLFLQDFVTNLDDDKWYMSAEYTFEVVSRGVNTWLPQDCIDKIRELDSGYCKGSIVDNTNYSVGTTNFAQPANTDICILEPGLKFDGAKCPNQIFDDQKVNINGDKFVFSFDSTTSLSGMTCTKIYDPGQSNGWGDNFLCTNTNVGFKFSYNGTIPNMKCLNMREGGNSAWNDNYLCWDPNSKYDFKWSDSGVPQGVPPEMAVRIFEPSSPSYWRDNYLGVIPPADSSKCTTFNGYKLCENDPIAALIGSPSPSINHLAKTVDVNLESCGPFTKDMVADSCKTFRSKPECKVIKSECMNKRADGVCILQTNTYDCGKDVVVSDVKSTQTTSCTGVVRCMGSDCIEPKMTQSGSFNEVAAKLQAAQFMTQDMNCGNSSSGTPNPSNCKVFSGKPLTCKTAVGGVQDCCDVPTNLSAGDYIQGLLAMGKLDSSLMALQEGSAIKGVYQVVRTPIANTVSTVTKPFASYIENISSAAKEFVSPVSEFVEQLKKQVQDAISDIMKDLFKDTTKDLTADAAGSEASQQAAEKAGEKAAEEVMKNIAGAASVIMTVYTIYVVAVMVIQAAFPCEPPEFELAAKKSVKSCVEVGSYCAKKALGSVCIEKLKSYCCYNSPLSRIVNQQLRSPASSVLGTFGPPENPSCDGLTISQLATVDWTKVDLSEWTALLTQHGLQPKPSLMNMDSLTGSGNTLNRIDGNRLDAGERTEERFKDLNTDQIRNDALFNSPPNVGEN